MEEHSQPGHQSQNLMAVDSSHKMSYQAVKQPTNDITITPGPSSNASIAAHQRWLSRSKRAQTNLEEVLTESRVFRHAHIVRRPRPLQFHSSEDGTPPRQEHLLKANSNDSRGDGEERSTDNLWKQLNRVDLFVDLVWVGIIANISHTYSDGAFSDSGVSAGTAFLEFMLLFIPIWRVWDQLRDFGSNFYNDDMFQRQFMCWILILAVVYGINAPYAYSPDEGGNSLTLLITVYLIARASFLVAHGVQSLFMPFLRRQLLFIVGFGIATSSLWIAAIWVAYPSKIALLIVANLIEHLLELILASPLGDRLITGGWKRTVHVDHYIERHEGFFIIILGEGVFRLVEGSPSGLGINAQTGTVITTLLLYYVIHWLYFNGDQSKAYVHALRRTWWKPVLWQMYHIFMFAALLILAASTRFLVDHRAESVSHIESRSPDATNSGSSSAATEEPVSENDSHFVLYALWSASISLGVVVFSMTHIAVLNLPLDKPNTLVVSSRYLRLAPRIPATALIACLPLFKGLTGGTWSSAALVILYSVFMWEWFAGLEKNWKFFEPKNE